MKRYGKEIYSDYLKLKKQFKSLENQVNKRFTFLVNTTNLPESISQKHLLHIYKDKEELNNFLNSYHIEYKLNLIMDIEKDYESYNKQLSMF